MYIVMAFGICLAAVLYLGTRLSSLIPSKRPIKKRPVYWIIVSCSIGLVFLQRSAGIGFLLYLSMLYLMCDLLFFILKGRAQWLYQLYARGWTILCIAAAISIYGFVNANQIVVTSYEITKAPAEYSVLMMSDIHLGTGVSLADLSKAVTLVNEQEPDIICLCGDLYDERTTEKEIEASYEILGRLKSKYGVYYVEGNHEVSLEQHQEILKELRKQNIIVLLDQVVKVQDQLYIAGRKDYSDTTAGKRMSLVHLLEETKASDYIILLDHQPRELKEVSALGVDLALSGHTHAGQVYPANYFAAALNEQNYGLKWYEGMASITSSGLGTWGFVMRTCKHCEIVRIHLIP